MIRYATVCSGIEAASVAWGPLGWKPVFFSEIEPFPCAVLEHHYPDVPNLGDMLKINGHEWRGKVDVLAGGTPCQAFSVAGNRKSLADDRGNLTLKFVELADEIKPAIVVWENVPGVLSTRDNAFGCLLSKLVGADRPLLPLSDRSWPGYGLVAGPKRVVAWRVLDAQHFGVAQRRRRVVLVAFDAGINANPGAVLFEPESLPRHNPPGAEEGQGVAALTGAGVGTCGADDNQAQAGHLLPTHSVAPCLQEKGGKGVDSDCTQALVCVSGDVAHALRGGKNGYCGSEDGTGRGIPIIAGIVEGDSAASTPDLPRLRAGCGRGGETAIAFTQNQDGDVLTGDVAPSMGTNQNASGRNTPKICDPEMQVRRLIPVECERLQGFWDNYTNIPFGRPKYPDQICPDGHRYRALGNSWAVPKFRWVGQRIQMVWDVIQESAV